MNDGTRKTVNAVLIPLMVVLFIGPALAADTETAEKKTFEIRGRSFVVEKTRKVLEAARPGPGTDRSWSRTFYVQATGPLLARYVFDPEDETKWRITRAFPTRGGESPVSYGWRAYCVTYERPFTKKWVQVFGGMMRDISLAMPKTPKDRESLYIQLMNRDRGDTLAEIKKRGSSMGGLGRFALISDDDENPALDSIFINADRVASFRHHNLGVKVLPNFSDVKQTTDFYTPPVTLPIPVPVAVAVRDFLEQPFPEADKILHARRGRLIGQFALDAEEVKVGKPVKLVLTFGIDALSMSEMVRLKATNGGFQRQGKDIVYRPDKKGTHKLVVEAFCGFHWDGRIDYAERREIEVVVVE